MKYLLILCLASIINSFTESSAQIDFEFDFSGINELNKVITSLQHNEEPSIQQWDRLFSSPGYLELNSHESYFNDDLFKRYFRIAFNPGKRAELEMGLQEGDPYLVHYNDYLTKLDSITIFIEHLQDDDFKKQVVAKLIKFLPDEITKKPVQIPLCFILFYNDARGYDPVIIDLACVFKFGDEAADLLAHEVHHYIRRKNQPFSAEQVKYESSSLVAAINALQSEGIADQIDKHNSFFGNGSVNNSEQAVRYRNFVDRAPSDIIKLNAILSEIADSDSESAREKLGRDFLAAIPNSGHPTGYYMSRKIIEKLGYEPLIKTVGNPFEFIYLYNIAVKDENSLIAFSNNSIQYLRSLEEQYISNPEKEFVYEAFHSGVSLSGIKVFYEIYDSIQMGIYPSDQLWDRLLYNRAYSTLRKWESYDSEPIRKYLLTMGSPDKKGVIDEVPIYFKLIIEDREKIDSVIMELEQTDILKDPLSSLIDFIPENILANNPAPEVYFTFFKYDWRFGYDVMVVDPHRYSRFKKNFYPHLYFFVVNHYRNFVDTVDYYSYPANFTEFLYLLNRIELAGLAYTIMNETVSESVVSQLELFDQLLTRGFDEGILSDEYYSSFSQFWSKNYIEVGHYLNNAIIYEMGRDAIKDYFGKPLMLFKLYNDMASRSSSCFIFSEKSQKLIDLLIDQL